MIARLYDRHPGAAIAVVASGPSAAAFRPGEAEVAIGVNGAAHLAERGLLFDYFVAGSRRAPERAWWPLDCARVRIICRRIAALDRRLYPEADFPDLPRRAYPRRPFAQIELPAPVEPHLTYRYTRRREARFLAGRRRFERLVIGGTTAAKAVQLAFLMGGSRLRLYGCAFSSDTSGAPGHYFYRAPEGQIGGIVDNQRRAMERTLAVVRRAGVVVEAVGATRLTEIDRRIEAA